MNKQTVNKGETVPVKETTKPAEQTQKKSVTKTDKKAVSAPVEKKTETKPTPNAKKLKSKK